MTTLVKVVLPSSAPVTPGGGGGRYLGNSNNCHYVIPQCSISVLTGSPVFNTGPPRGYTDLKSSHHSQVI